MCTLLLGVCTSHVMASAHFCPLSSLLKRAIHREQIHDILWSHMKNPSGQVLETESGHLDSSPGNILLRLYGAVIESFPSLGLSVLI